MEGDRIVFADRGQITMWRAAGAHIVLGVDFEEAQRWLLFQNAAVMLGLEADTGAGRDDGVCRRHGKSGVRFPAPLEAHAGRWIGSSEPGPSGVSVVAQVPFG